MEEKKLIESESLKKSIIEFTIDKLENCEEFKQNVGGKRFIKSQFNKFLKKVYISEEKSRNLGEYCIGENIIILYPKDKKAMEPEVKLHEAIHCILSRKDGKKLTSGIICRNDTPISGMGLNEGLTEWIVDKANLRSTGYENEKNIINQLEIKFGKNKIMRFAKGDTEKEIPQLLGMTKQEYKTFAYETDLLYNSECFSRALSMKIQEIKENQKLHKELRSTIEIPELLKSDYKNYIEENELQDEDKTQLKYYTNKKKETAINIIRQKYKIENKIYELYFENEMSILYDKKNVSTNDAKEYIKKYDKYFKVVFDGAFARYEGIEFYREMDLLDDIKREFNGVGAEFADERISMLATYQQTRNRLCEPIIEETINKIKNSTISPQEFDENLKIILNPEKLEKIVVELLPENSKKIDDILKILRHNSPSEMIKNGMFYKLETESESREIYLDGNSKQISLEQANEEKKKLIDFTTPMGCSYQKTIENFGKFLQESKKQQPNATVKILNDSIILQNDGKNEFYFFEGEEIKKAKIIQAEKVNINFKEDKSLAIIQPKDNIFTKIVQLLKRKKSQNIEEDIQNKDKVIERPTVKDIFVASLKPDSYEYTQNKQENKKQIDIDRERE